MARALAPGAPHPPIHTHEAQCRAVPWISTWDKAALQTIGRKGPRELGMGCGSRQSVPPPPEEMGKVDRNYLLRPKSHWEGHFAIPNPNLCISRALCFS